MFYTKINEMLFYEFIDVKDLFLLIIKVLIA
jgi:hypothetical protein